MLYGRRLRSQRPHLPGANDLDITKAKKGAEKRKSLTEDSKKQAWNCPTWTYNWPKSTYTKPFIKCMGK